MTQDSAIDEAVLVLQRVLESDPQMERSAVRRVFSESVRAWPGDVDANWWKWLSESARSLEMRTKVLDCDLDEAITIARGGSQIVCYRRDASTSEHHFLGVVGRDGGNFLTFQPAHGETVATLGSLKRMLSEFAGEGRFRCVVFQPLELTLVSDGGADKQPPLKRLWQLMIPEFSDIWIVLVFAFFVSLFALATPIAVETLVNTVAFGRFLQPIVVLALILLVFLGFQGAIRALQTYVVEIIQRRLFARVAGDLAYRLPRARVDSTDGMYLPELVNRFFDVVTVQKVASKLLLDGIGLILSAIVGMAVLGFYHPWLLGFDLFLLAAIAVIIFGLGRGAIPSAIVESKHKYYMAAWLEDIARCPVAFRGDAGAEFAMQRADRHIHEYFDARRRHFRILMRQILFALGFQAVASTVLLGLGGWLVVTGELTLGQLVAAELIVTVIVGSFAKLGKHMESFYDLLAAVDKLGSLFDLPIERQDGLLVVDNSKPAAVRLDSVGHTSRGSGRGFDKLTVDIPAGANVAFIGGAGSGKSLLSDLIYGSRNPSSGRVLIDGIEPRSFRPDVLRSRIALARHGEIFHATVEENVHLQRPETSSAAVQEVLEALELLDPIRQLPDGIGTMLTSNGAPLSNAQLRLLEIARAAVARPALLVVDGCLDTLGTEDLDSCFNVLLAEDRPWTLIVMTSRRDIASRLEQTIHLDQSNGAK